MNQIGVLFRFTQFTRLAINSRHRLSHPPPRRIETSITPCNNHGSGQSSLGRGKSSSKGPLSGKRARWFTVFEAFLWKLLGKLPFFATLTVH